MRWSTSTLVAAFVAVDLAVVAGAYALGHQGGDDAGSAAASGSSQASGASSAVGRPDWTGPLYLEASPSGRLARVTRGSCDSREPVRSRVWLAAAYLGPLREVTVPGLQETLGVRVDDDRVSIVGVGPRCRASGFESTDGGRTWQRGAVPDDEWYLDTDTTARTIHGPVPGGARAAPCMPVGVTTVTSGSTPGDTPRDTTGDTTATADEALVSCGDDAVYRLSAGATGKGTTLEQYSVQNPVAAADDGERTLALAAPDNCAAALVGLAQNGPVQRLSCLGQDVAALGLATSEPDGAPTRIFVQVGYQLRYSTDGGEQFTAYPD